MASKGKQTHDGTPLVDAPLPLVTLDNSGKFVVGTEATNLIRQIKGEIAVIAIAGIYRYVIFLLPVGRIVSRGGALLLHIRPHHTVCGPLRRTHRAVCSIVGLSLTHAPSVSLSMA